MRRPLVALLPAVALWLALEAPGHANPEIKIEGAGAGVRLERLRRVAFYRDLAQPPQDVPLVYRPLQQDGPARYRDSSFVLDFRHPDFAPVKEAARRSLGADLSPQQLGEFVRGYIRKNTMRRIYDVASVVATDQEGDCTEHAVLLAALLRAFGHAARVVHGLHIAQGARRATGHAWVEYHAPEGWRVLDSSMPREHRGLRLPLFLLPDEGPEFFGAYLRAVVRHIPQRIAIEQTPDDPSP